MTAPVEQTSRFKSRAIKIDTYEAWRAMDGFDGYEVSNFGRVRSWFVGGGNLRKRSEEPRIITQRDNQNGYPCVSLSRSTEQKLLTVHGLVLTAFICQRPGGYEAAHLNGDRSVTSSTNEFHKKLHGTSADGERSYRARVTTAQASEIKRRALAGESSASLAREFGICRSSVYAMKIGKSWSWAISEYDARNM